MAKKKILKDNGKEILPITHESCVLDNNGVSIGSKIGNINELATDSKTDLVSAINDILQFNSETKDAKQQLVNLLITNGIFGSTSESWESLINKIQQISPGDGDGGNDSLYSFIHGVNIGELELERRLLKTYNSVYTVHEETLNSSTYDALCVNIDINPSATTPGIVYYVISTKERIDFTSIDSIELTGRVYCPNGSSTIGIEYGAYDINITGITGYGWDASVPNYIISSGKLCPKDQVNFQTFTLDTTSLTGNHYFAVTFGCNIPTNYSSNGSICNLNMDVTNITFKGEGLGSEGSNSSGGGLDIISATELPATGRENQICVITDTPVNSFLLSSYESDISALDSSTIGIYLNDDATVYDSTKIALSSNNITVNYYINSVSQGDARLASYIYNNSKWNSLTYKSYPVIENRKLITSYVGNFASDVIIDSEYNGFEISNSSSSSSYRYSIISASKKINFDNISKAEFEIRSNRSTTNVDFYIGVTQAERLNQAYNAGGTLDMCSSYNSINFTHSDFKKYTMDLSNVTGSGYLALVMYCTSLSTTIYIPNLILY